MTVAAEGIETKEQLALLAREPAIEEVQGFLIGVPMPKTDIRKLLLSPGTHLASVGLSRVA
jgi:EAL domain-containing protein (putative c-di-GMP-specific phosphodiesterase class I)